MRHLASQDLTPGHGRGCEVCRRRLAGKNSVVPWWAWFLLGGLAGAASYLVLGNVTLFLRSRRARVATAPDRVGSYVAVPGARRVVNFKGEDEAEGDVIGPVFITDEDDPAFLHEIGWMKRTDARELARGLGHPFSDD